MVKDLQQQITVLKEQLDKLSTDKQSTESRLTGDLDALHRRLLGKNRPGGYKTPVHSQTQNKGQ